MKIGNPGAFLVAVLALPLGFAAARNVQAPRVPVSEAVSPFQWNRMATLLVVIVALAVAMDCTSTWMRQRLLSR